MSLIDEIWNTFFNYRGLGRALDFLNTPEFRKYNRGSVHAAISRMHRQGFIVQKKDHWVLTPLGKKQTKRKVLFQKFTISFPKDAPKNLIVMFDIPESRKGERDWFRRHLKQGNYELIQKSVWVGPSPLPKEFLDYIKKIGLKNSIKTFKLAKGYKK